MAAFLMPRFYLDGALAVGTTTVLPPGASHHARRVLRLGPGEPVALFNGQGGEYHGRLSAHGAEGLAVVIERFVAREAECPLAIHIGQGLAGAEKMDWIVEKAVEVGVQSCQPLALERSVLRLEGERAQRRVQRWQEIARAASEQCGRNRVLVVEPIAALKAWLALLPEPALRIALAPGVPEPLTDVDPARLKDPVFLAIGPEGGFTEGELTQLKAAGFDLVSLGRRVLRTETAALVAATVLETLWNLNHRAGAAGLKAGPDAGTP